MALSTWLSVGSGNRIDFKGGLEWDVMGMNQDQMGKGRRRLF